MVETPKLDLDAFESEHDMGTQMISVSDHISSFQYAPEIPDSFVIDMESFSSGINKESNTNSRIAFQRSLSRKGSQKGSQHGGDKKANGNTALHVHDRDTVPPTCSPRGGMVVSGMPEKPAMVAVGSTDHSSNTQVHHQITVMAGNMSSATTESRCIARRNSFRRSSWALDPKRVLLLFATLSSMGTLLLIYFTLTISKQNAHQYGADWQH